jgi:predicted PhzF superfamily epimerase YddE/YHI9
MTAFAVLKSPRNPSVYTIRWFTPDHEEELCGHATFATAHVLAGLPANSQLHAFAFESRSGPVTAERTEDGLIQLDFPADDLTMLARGEWEEIEKAALASLHGLARVRGVYRGRYDVTIEVIMNNGVRLDEVDVNHHALVGPLFYSQPMMLIYFSSACRIAALSSPQKPETQLAHASTPVSSVPAAHSSRTPSEARHIASSA